MVWSVSSGLFLHGLYYCQYRSNDIKGITFVCVCVYIYIYIKLFLMQVYDTFVTEVSTCSYFILPNFRSRNEVSAYLYMRREGEGGSLAFKLWDIHKLRVMCCVAV